MSRETSMNVIFQIGKSVKQHQEKIIGVVWNGRVKELSLTNMEFANLDDQVFNPPRGVSFFTCVFFFCPSDLAI